MMLHDLELGVDLVRLALTIAESAHADQVDKAGRPYMDHIRAVMAGVATDDERIVAAVHDVLEDCTDWSPDRLIEEGIPAQLVESVVALTRREGESYEAFVARVAADPVACAVKIADLRHNMDLTRLPLVTEADRSRVEKYERALVILTA